MVNAVYQFTYRYLHFIWRFVGVAIVDQVMVSGVSFIVGFYLARHLGIALFGQFSLLMLITYFCLELQRAVITAPMMTFLAHDDNPDYLTQLGYIQIIFNGVLSITAAGFVYASGFIFAKWGIQAYSSLSLFIVFARLQQEFLRRTFFVQNFSRRALTLDAITFVCILGSIMTLVHTHRLSLSNVLWWHIAAYLCPSFLAMRYVLTPLTQTGNWRLIVAKHLRFGKWLAGGTVVQFLSSNWLIMMSGAILGASTVGLIKSAQYLMCGVTMLFQAFENIVPLQLARLYRKNDQRHTQQYLRQFGLILMGFVVLYIAIMIPLIPLFAEYLKITDKPLFHNLAVNLLLQGILLGIVLILNYMLRARSITRPIFMTHSLTAIITVTSAPYIIANNHEMGVVHGLGIIQCIVIACLSFALYRNRTHA